MKNKILSMFGAPFASKMLSLIPQESKDNIVMHFINDQRDFIINMISEKMSEYGIEAEIKDIALSYPDYEQEIIAKLNQFETRFKEVE